MQVGPLFMACYNMLNECVAVEVKNCNVISAYGLLYILWIQDIVRGTVGCGISHRSMYTEHSFIRSFINSFVHSFIHSFVD